MIYACNVEYKVAIKNDDVEPHVVKVLLDIK